MIHHLLHSLPPPSPNPQLHSIPTPTPPLTLSRRSLSAAAAISLIPTYSFAAESLNTATNDCDAAAEPTTKTAFLDVSIDGDPAGRITVGLYGGGAPAGAARFASLVTGAAGISYRRKEFVKIMPNYIQHAGVRSYGADAELAGRSGMDPPAAEDAGGVVAEWAAAAGGRCSPRNVAGAVGIVVRDPAKPPPKVKVVARNGRLEAVEEEVGVSPNGTEFVIVIRDSPELDESVLVVGRVVGGMEVVERILKVRSVKENTSSPYFR